MKQISPKQAKKALWLLTILNYFNYIDRYMLAALLVPIKAELGLSDAQAGLLMTAFLVPYMITSPIFGWMGDNFNRSKILAWGVAIWCVASMGTGWAPTFALLLVMRFILGIGESAFEVISVPFISEHYPSEKRGKVMSIIYTAMPVGAALGMVVGGVLGEKYGWRNAFYILGFPGLILAFMISRLPEPRAALAKVDAIDVKKIIGMFKSKTFNMISFGLAAQVFALGGMAFWFPTYLQRGFGLSEVDANSIVGGVTVVTGVFGTLVGGVLGDRYSKKYPNGQLYVSAYSTLLSLPFFVGTMLTNDQSLFTVLFAISGFLLFISTGPITVAIVECAPLSLRTSSNALAMFVGHLFGDAISSPIIGVVSDSTGSLRTGILICAPMIFIAAVLWWIGARLPRVNYE